MELRDCVGLFATETFFDVFTPTTTFSAKINPFAEVTNSGSASQRRILETAHDITIPTTRVIQSPSGEKLIVGDSNVDYWAGEVIRYKYPVYPVDVMGEVGTIGQTLTATQADKQVYVYPFFIGREPDAEEKSDYLSRYELYFPKVKVFTRGNILKYGSDYFRLKTDTNVDGAGFGAALAVKLESAIRTFTIKSNGTTYDETTDGYTETTYAGVSCFVEPLEQDYEFVTPSFTEIEPGDLAISVMKTAVAMKVNDWIGGYKVLSIRDSGTWNTCQCRNMGV